MGSNQEEIPKSRGESSSQVATPPETITIYPRDLRITRSNKGKYWKLPEKTSTKSAELIKVCWLQVTGSTEQVGKGKSYEIKFNISFTDTAFGWNGLPLFLMAKTGEKGRYQWKKIKPLEQTRVGPFDIPTDSEDKFIVNVPKKDNEQEGNEKLFFGLYEIWSNQWKGGLCINHATVKELEQPNKRNVAR